MIDWPTIIAGVTALIGAIGVKELIVGWSARRSGAAQEEKFRMQELIRENDAKDARIDSMLESMRKQREYSSYLRRMLIEKGVPVETLPEWPKESEK